MKKEEQLFWMQIKKKEKKTHTKNPQIFKHIVEAQVAKLWKCIMKLDFSPFPFLLFEC